MIPARVTPFWLEQKHIEQSQAEIKDYQRRVEYSRKYNKVELLAINGQSLSEKSNRPCLLPIPKINPKFKPKPSPILKNKAKPKPKPKLKVERECEAKPKLKSRVSILSQPVKILPLSSKNTFELSFCRELAIKVNGQTEVNTPDGRIDVLTSSCLIEVKVARNWKHGIGQLLVYGAYHPEKQLTLVLIGEHCEICRYRAIKHCAKLNIDVFTEYDYGWEKVNCKRN